MRRRTLTLYKPNHWLNNNNNKREGFVVPVNSAVKQIITTAYTNIDVVRVFYHIAVST